MSLVAFANQGFSEEELKEGAEASVRLYAEKAKKLEPGNTIPYDEHVSLKLQNKGSKSFILDVEKASKVGLFTQHTAEEFNMKVLKIDSQIMLRKFLLKLNETGSQNMNMMMKLDQLQ